MPVSALNFSAAASLPHLRSASHVSRVRRQRHRFLAAGDDDVGVSTGDMQHAERDCPQSRAAHLIEAPGRLVFGDARLHGGLPRRVCRWPAVSTWPRITSSTSLPASFARSRPALMATAPRSCAGRLTNAPLNDPTGVLDAEAITMSVMIFLLYSPDLVQAARTVT